LGNFLLCELDDDELYCVMCDVLDGVEWVCLLEEFLLCVDSEFDIVCWSFVCDFGCIWLVVFDLWCSRWLDLCDWVMVDDVEWVWF